MTEAAAGQSARKALGERVVLALEKPLKQMVFDCRMCGQCILHSTGLTCPMRCPKNLRNGPCGGVRADGNCEVYPDKPCVWRLAWERSRKLPLWRDDMLKFNPPVDWRLRDSSSWLNFFDRRDRHVPAGWRTGEVANGEGSRR